jgi:hypothetical protein
VKSGNFSLRHRVQTGSGAHPTSYPMGIGAPSLGVKRPDSEADHSPLSSGEVKNAWRYTSTPPIRLHGVVLSWEQDATLPNKGTTLFYRVLFQLSIVMDRCARRKSRDSSVGIATGYGLDDRSSIPGEGWKFFSSTLCPDRLWGPPILLSNGCWGFFPWR